MFCFEILSDFVAVTTLRRGVTIVHSEQIFGFLFQKSSIRTLIV